MGDEAAPGREQPDVLVTFPSDVWGEVEVRLTSELVSQLLGGPTEAAMRAALDQDRQAGEAPLSQLADTSGIRIVARRRTSAAPGSA